MLGVEDGKLNTYFNHRTKVIEPAVDEVNAITLIPSNHNSKEERKEGHGLSHGMVS
jgi:hypothetical protein